MDSINIEYFNFRNYWMVNCIDCVVSLDIIKVGNNQETPRFYFTALLLCSSVHLCVCSLCLESRKAITCLATPPGTRVHDLWCMRYLYVMCVHVSVCEF